MSERILEQIGALPEIGAVYYWRVDEAEPCNHQASNLTCADLKSLAAELLAARRVINELYHGHHGADVEDVIEVFLKQFPLS